MRKSLSFWCMACLGVFLVLASNAVARPPATTLGAQAEVSLLTCAPGQELYSTFGHTALRIQDPETHLDWVYNYGVFEFDTPNFILKFAQGKLPYYCLGYSFRHFYAEYDAEGRSIREQVLNLTLEQKQAIFSALQVNELPENRYYAYDFFYDNCATRERDIVAKTLGADLKFNPRDNDDYGSFRDLIDPYLRNEIWADFGIDIVLGSPTDKAAHQQGAVFLPDFLFEAFSTAEIRMNGQWMPLVKTTATLLDIPAPPVTAFQYGPHLLGWSIFAVIGLLTFWGYRIKRALKSVDFLLFFVLGLLGALLLLFWTATDHQATFWNFNLLWANPLHLIYAFALLFRRFGRFVGSYAKVYCLVMVLFLALSWLPLQDYHNAIIPIAMAATLRFGWMWKVMRSNKAG
jgi:hypothetical protein